MNHPSRTIRVFISSTFRDFAEERNLLVRKVFPELRRKCRERQVELVDVDLRWGITEEEAKQGKILPICLAEIDRSRPYFIGLLGERYGWVPDKAQYELSLLLEQPWIEEHRGGKSVTELEILHGVLNNPEMAGHAFFYFRDPAWSKRKGGVFISDDDGEKTKIDSLKSQIRRSGFPVLENYRNPEALVEQVRNDLWNLINETYPENEVPDAQTMERRRHEAYSAQKTRFYMGGERYFEALDKAMKGGKSRPVLICGQAGGGKSALLANWVAKWSAEHPKAVVITHYLGCGADAAEPVRMATRLIREIALIIGDEFIPEADPDRQIEQLQAWFTKAGSWAKRCRKDILLVIDGLDKLPDRQNMLWLPVHLPPKLKLVASSGNGKILETLRIRYDWLELALAPFNKLEQRNFIVKYLEPYRKNLTLEQIDKILSHKLAGIPLFLITVLEELRLFGVYEELESRLNDLLSLQDGKVAGEEFTLDDIFGHVLERIETDAGRKQVKHAMEAIWSSRAGLAENELLSIAHLTPAQWATARNALADSLYEADGKINFAHDYLRNAVKARYRMTGQRERNQHQKMAQWFAKNDVDARLAEELPWQLLMAGNLSALKECLLDVALFRFLISRDHSELLSYWRHLNVDDISTEYQQVWTQWAEDLSPEHLLLGNFLYFAGYYDDFVESIYGFWLGWAYQNLGNSARASLHCANELSALLMQKGNLVESAEIAETALGNAHATLGEKDPLTQRLLCSYACALGGIGHDDAEQLFRTLIDWLLASGETETPTYGLALYNLGELLRRNYEKTNDSLLIEGADDCFRAAHDVQSRVLGPIHVDTLRSLAAQTHWLITIGSTGTAEEILHAALDGLTICLGSDHPETLRVVGNLGVLYLKKGEYKNAEIVIRGMLEKVENRLGPTHEDVLIGYANLGQALSLQGKCKEAKASLIEALTRIQDQKNNPIYEFIISEIRSLGEEIE